MEFVIAATRNGRTPKFLGEQRVEYDNFTMVNLEPETEYIIRIAPVINDR